MPTQKEDQKSQTAPRSISVFTLAAPPGPARRLRCDRDLREREGRSLKGLGRSVPELLAVLRDSWNEGSG
jgi:hypothetical protein